MFYNILLLYSTSITKWKGRVPPNNFSDFHHPSRHVPTRSISCFILPFGPKSQKETDP